VVRLLVEKGRDVATRNNSALTGQAIEEVKPLIGQPMAVEASEEMKTQIDQPIAASGKNEKPIIRAASPASDGPTTKSNNSSSRLKYVPTPSSPVINEHEK
jgi:hypothetical protein